MRPIIERVRTAISPDLLLRIARFALSQENSTRYKQLKLVLGHHNAVDFNWSWGVVRGSLTLKIRYRNAVFPSNGISFPNPCGAFTVVDLAEAIVYAIAWSAVSSRLWGSTRRRSIQRDEARSRAAQAVEAFRAQKAEFYTAIEKERHAEQEAAEAKEDQKKLLQAFKDSPQQKLDRLAAQEKRLLTKKKRIDTALKKLHRSRAQLLRYSGQA